MARAYLLTEPPVPFDDLAAGLVALQMASTTQPHLKLIVEADDEDCYLDVEYAIVDGRPRQVLGSPRWWAWQDRVGEKEALGVWVKQDRYRIARGLVGGLPTQAEMDLLTDFVQWLGTPVGCCFMASIQGEIDAALRRPRAASRGVVGCSNAGLERENLT